MSTQNRTFRKRCKRYDLPGHAHYLTFSCFQRRPFLSRDRSRGWFLDAVETARRRHGFDLWAFVLMPKHVHLLILPPEGGKIGAILKSIKQPVTQRTLLWVKRHAPSFLDRMADVQPSGKRSHRFWQRGGGYDRNLWSADEIHEKLKYIHGNPVRRGLVTAPEQWPWSSARAWAHEADEPIRIDRESLPPPDVSS